MEAEQVKSPRTAKLHNKAWKIRVELYTELMDGLKAQVSKVWSRKGAHALAGDVGVWHRVTKRRQVATILK